MDRTENLIIALTVWMMKRCHGHYVRMVFSTTVLLWQFLLVFFKKRSSLSLSRSISTLNDQTFEVSSLHCTAARGRKLNMFMKY